MDTQLINKLNNIDFSNLNVKFYLNQLERLHNNPEQFTFSESNFQQFIDNTKQYKTEFISILYTILYTNNFANVLGWENSNLSQNKKLKLLLIPFITPLSINTTDTFFGYKHDNNYINLSIFNNYELFKNSKITQIKAILQLYTQPDKLFIYCIRTINKFLKTFKSKSDTPKTNTDTSPTNTDTSPTNTDMSPTNNDIPPTKLYNNIRPKLIYEFSS